MIPILIFPHYDLNAIMDLGLDSGARSPDGYWDKRMINFSRNAAFV